MSVFTCCGSKWHALSRAAAKSASAQLRRVGLLAVRVDWAARAELCERCPMRVVRRGISYCGKPLFEQIERDPAIDGCGCPTHAKAKSPDEHCPLTSTHRPISGTSDCCDCKWCTAAHSCR